MAKHCTRCGTHIETYDTNTLAHDLCLACAICEPTPNYGLCVDEDCQEPVMQKGENLCNQHLWESQLESVCRTIILP